MTVCTDRGAAPWDKKRSLLLIHRLNEEVLADAPHRQWVFTIPKRLRVYFRYERSLLGKLCRATYDTICEVFKLEIDGDCGVPAMIGAVQTFGDLIHFHPHIHAIVAEGIFTESGHFVHIPNKGEHQIRYYGFYSNKKRGMHEKRNRKQNHHPAAMIQTLLTAKNVVRPGLC